MPAAVMGDMCVCVGPPDTIIMGSTGVFIGGKPAARMGDPTVHGGLISVGCPTVLIGEVAPGTPQSPVSPLLMKSAMLQMVPGNTAIADQIISMRAAAKNGAVLCESCSRMVDKAGLAVLNASEKAGNAAGKALNATTDFLKHTNLKIGGNLEISVGPQVSAKATVLGASAGATANASSINLLRLKGNLGASIAEGFDREGEVSWVGKNKSFEVGQEISGELLVGGGVEHSTKYKQWKKTEDTTKGSVGIGPVDIGVEKKGKELTESAEFTGIGFNLAFLIGIKGSLSVSLEHDNET
jgi:hypothetical protein